ncbi:MAG: heme peroxidase family protein [Vicinamibacterales bacterium]
MSGFHGQALRGLMSTPRSPLFQGRFGRMFRWIDPASFGRTEADNEAALKALGAAMSADFDGPKDGKDEEESGIPALYTYFGQFVDHDITFDPTSSLQKQNDPDALVDFRTPALDLDNVYGSGPGDQPYLYDGDRLFLLGDPIGGGSDAAARDLPRNSATPRRALIGDPRNDENVIVSQLQGLFLRFHNRMAADHPTLAFADIHKLVRFHYQYVVLNDFLPRIVASSVLDALKDDGEYDHHRLRFYHWKNEPFMPVEFSVAAYRFGHSMVRPGYRLNDNILLPIFPVPSQGLPEGLTGFRAMNPQWALDWGRLIDVDARAYDGSPADKARRLQFAYRIDTSLVNPLATLPDSVAVSPASLAARNLLRGWRMGLPSGQQVARAMGVRPLDDRDILIGKATGTAGDARSILDPSLNLPSVFTRNCPLWTYILAEAMQNQEQVKIPVLGNISVATPKLGPVGGRIVAEVFLGMMFGDSDSMLSLDPHWQPPAGPAYGLTDFVKYALGL